MNREELLRELSALDFMAVDLHLFLDTHPNDHEANVKFNQIVSNANSLRAEYEKLYGPLSSFRSNSPCPWKWIEDPWPWNYCFNFKLPKEVCR